MTKQQQNKAAQKLRVLFDTNIYGLIVEKGLKELVDRIVEEKPAIIYGSRLIRNELRETPKELSVGGRNLRITMLTIYDLLVEKHEIPLTDLTKYLGLDYAKELGKSALTKNMNDFLIVASASLKQLDIVCSEDNKTMLSKQAQKIYSKVNKANDLPVPKFIPLKKFDELIKQQ